MRLRVAFVGCLLAGCGSISDNGNNIDAAIVTDTTAPMILSSGPANDAAGIVPLSPISAMFDEPLDPATVTADTVKVTYLQRVIPIPYFVNSVLNGIYDEDFIDQTWPGSRNEPILGDVSYDPMFNKVVFSPKSPLLPGESYTVSFEGVKDVAGNAFAGMPIKFRTIVNAEAHRYRFNTGNGLPTVYYDFDPDTATGRLTREAQRITPGPDGTWHTSDDELGFLYNIKVADDGRITEERFMVAGPDGMLDTPDDLPSASIFYTYDSSNRLTERALMYGPGPDNMYGTPDDSFHRVTTATFNGDEMVGTTTFNTAGTDTQWRTSDDRCSFQQEPAYTGSVKHRDVIKDCGADALPKTADDRIYKYREYTYDANGQLTATAYRTDLGPDGIWFTADDRGGAETKYERDAKGRITMTTFKTIGPDGKWNTADDDISSYDKMTYDEKGLLTEDTFFYSKGPDAMWNTADDLVSSYVVNTYDERGVRLKSQTFSAGVDSVAKTADDRIMQDSRFDVVH
ncbi:MAG: Ig-like domain-containing protein [Kofleriaceae bacterium]|nr:Ig-like domain-containing protein [Kofleriaceae bacterium]